MDGGGGGWGDVLYSWSVPLSWQGFRNRRNETETVQFNALVPVLNSYIVHTNLVVKEKQPFPMPPAELESKYNK